MTFNEAKLQQLNAIGTYRVYGQPLELEQTADVAGVSARNQWRAIRPCLCVQDSPGNPCQCDLATLWWLSGDAVVAQGHAGRKDHHGKDLQFFDVLVDSKIMVESLTPVSVGTLKGLGDKVAPERIFDLAAEKSGNDVPRTMQSLLGDIVKHVLAELVLDVLRANDLAAKLNQLVEDEKKKTPPK